MAKTDAAPDAPEAKPKKQSKPTEYHLLRAAAPAGSPVEGEELPQPPRWEIVATLTANSEKQAKRRYFEAASKDADGEFSEELVAVPTRSWNPEALSIVRQPRIVFG